MPCQYTPGLTRWPATNDLQVARGADAVKNCIAAAQEVCEPAIESASGGVAEFPGIDERPCWRVYVQRFEQAAIAAPELVDQWICTPLRVLAITRNPQDGD